MGNSRVGFSSLDQLDALYADGKVSDEEYASLKDALSRTSRATPTVERQSLRRSWQGRVLAGVCAGMANGLNVEPWVLRLLFIVGLLVLGPITVAIYVGIVLCVPWDDPAANAYQTLPWVFAFGVGLGLVVLNIEVSVFYPRMVAHWEKLGSVLPTSTLLAVALAERFKSWPGLIAQGMLFFVAVGIQTYLPPKSKGRKVFSRVVYFALIAALVFLTLAGTAGF